MNKGQMKSCILLKWLGWTDEHEFLFLKTSHNNNDNNNSLLFLFFHPINTLNRGGCFTWISDTDSEKSI